MIYMHAYVRDITHEVLPANEYKLALSEDLTIDSP